FIASHHTRIADYIGASHDSNSTFHLGCHRSIRVPLILAQRNPTPRRVKASVAVPEAERLSAHLREAGRAWRSRCGAASGHPGRRLNQEWSPLECASPLLRGRTDMPPG